MEGKPDFQWDIVNPGESGVNTVKLPGTSPWFAAYFTSKLHETPEALYAYPCMFDFSSSPSYNMYNTSYSTIKNYVKRSASDIAVNVISPGSTGDNNWPNHCAIACANVGKINGTGDDVLHAFCHCEDAYRGQILKVTQVYEFINYARSEEGANFGTSFDKMTTVNNGNNVYPIIKYEVSEDDLYNSGDWGDSMIGCGAPSIIEKDDCYYMIYHVRPRRNIGTLANPVYVDASHEYYLRSQSIALATATVADVNDSNYAAGANPWKKYYELDANPWSQPGIGGKESILWNAWLNDAGQRTQWLNPPTGAHWRGFPKVSLNTWAEGYNDVGNYMMTCKGQNGNDTPVCTYIHNSSDLINWTTQAILVHADTDVLQRNYPTLIGDGGQSTLTTENNKLYYQKQFNDGSDNRQDLYRQSLRFEK